MSYEKHTWETGEVITAEKLNNIENGIDKVGLPIIKLAFTYEATTTITCETGYSAMREYLINSASTPIILDRYISNASQHYYEFATLGLGSGNDLIITSLNGSSAGIRIDCYTLKFSQGTISEVIQTTKTLE